MACSLKRVFVIIIVLNLTAYLFLYQINVKYLFSQTIQCKKVYNGSSSLDISKQLYNDYIIELRNTVPLEHIKSGLQTEVGKNVTYDVTREFRLFENVCIRQLTDMHPQLYPYQARFTVFTNGTLPAASNKPVLEPIYLGYTTPRNNFWIFDLTNASLPSEWSIRNEILVLPTFWMDSGHIFLFFYEILSRMHSQLHNAKLALERYPAEDRYMSRILVVPNIDKMPHEFRKSLLADGISQIVTYNDLLGAGKPTCFRHVVAGDRRISPRKTMDVLRKQANTLFHLDELVCTSYKVTLLRRLTSRHILNIAELAEAIRQHGYDVQIVSFEGKTIQEQLEILHCTSVFIAVQGAALAWMIFLPQNAMFIEIWFQGWPQRYRQRANGLRPDLNATAIECERRPSDDVMRKYALSWFNYTGEITDDMKLKLFQRSKKTLLAFGHVFKDSDCICSSKTIVDALPAPAQLLPERFQVRLSASKSAANSAPQKREKHKSPTKKSTYTRTDKEQRTQPKNSATVSAAQHSRKGKHS